MVRSDGFGYVEVGRLFCSYSLEVSAFGKEKHMTRVQYDQCMNLLLQQIGGQLTDITQQDKALTSSKRLGVRHY